MTSMWEAVFHILSIYPSKNIPNGDSGQCVIRDIHVRSRISYLANLPFKEHPKWWQRSVYNTCHLCGKPYFISCLSAHQWTFQMVTSVNVWFMTSMLEAVFYILYIYASKNISNGDSGQWMIHYSGDTEKQAGLRGNELSRISSALRFDKGRRRQMVTSRGFWQ